MCACILVCFQDIATYTRIAPNQREANFRKFVDRVNQCPKVCWRHLWLSRFVVMAGDVMSLYSLKIER